VACSGSDTSTGDGRAPGTAADPAAGCPFSGQLTPSSGPSQNGDSTTLTKISTRKDNCIDNVQFDFSPGTPAWSVSYQPGPFKDANGQAVTPAGKAFLVVELQGVTSSQADASAISSSSLNYVQSVQQTSSASGADQWVIGLSEKLEYTTSASGVPAYLVIGLG